MKRGWILGIVSGMTMALLVCLLYGPSVQAQKALVGTDGQKQSPSAVPALCGQIDVVPSANVGSTNNNFLFAVSALSSNDVWAVGSYTLSGRTLVEHWNGTAWSVVSSPSPGTSGSVLSGVSALASNDVWAVGTAQYGTIYQTLVEHWNGSRWSVVPSPNPGSTNNLKAVSALASNDVWAVGDYFDGSNGSTRQTLVEHWNGTAWIVVSSPSVRAGSNFLKGVSASASNDVWTVGYYVDSNSTDQMLVEHWDGRNWSVVPSANPDTSGVLSGVTALASNDVWAAGTQQNNGTHQTLVEHWNGTAWSIVPSSNLGSSGSYLEGVSALLGGDVWAVGLYFSPIGPLQTLVERYSGPCGMPTSTPSTPSTPSTRTPLPTITGTPGTATPAPTMGCASAFGIVASPNSGTGNSFLEAVSALSPGDIWAVGNKSGHLYISNTLLEHWDGTQWSIVPDSSPTAELSGDLHGVSALSPHDVWAVGSRNMNSTLVEHWDGTGWSIVPSPDVNSYSTLNAVSALSARDVWAVGAAGNGEGQETLIEHWDGTRWSIVVTPNVGAQANLLQGVVAFAPNDVWAVGYYFDSGPGSQERTLTEHWDGTHWSVVPSPNGGSYDNILRGVSGTAGNDVWAVGDYFNGGTTVDTLVEHWNGYEWNIVDSPNPRVGSSTSHMETVSAPAPDDVWAVGYYVLANGSNKTLVEHWNGIAWAVVASPNNGLWTGILQGVSARSSTATDASTDVWAVGNYDGSSPGVRTLVVHSQGQCVTPAPTPLACNVHFADVALGNTFYPFVACLACQGIVSGYPCGGSNPQDGQAEPCGAAGYPYFRYNNPVTRGQISKIVAESAHLTGDPGVQIFEDVPPGSPYYTYINRLSLRGYIGGYPCGGGGEPCAAGNRPYFRPGASLTRGELAKIAVEAAGIEEIQAGQIFADVPEQSTFYTWIQTLAISSIVGGYGCGGEREPCYGLNEPYYRPTSGITRGQAAKVVSGTFFPGCVTLAGP